LPGTGKVVGIAVQHFQQTDPFGSLMALELGTPDGQHLP
jgi:hypothetical protein